MRILNEDKAGNGFVSGDHYRTFPADAVAMNRFVPPKPRLRRGGGLFMILIKPLPLPNVMCGIQWQEQSCTNCKIITICELGSEVKHEICVSALLE